MRGFFAYDAVDWMCNAGKSYGLGPNFSESLLALGENKSITELDISGNKIGDAVLLPSSRSRSVAKPTHISPCAGCVRLLRAQGLMKVFDNLRANTALTWIAFDNNGAALGSLQALKNCVANGNQSLLSSHPLPSPVLCIHCTHSSCLPLPPKRCVFRATM
jgi:hypothetical protein